MVFTDAHSPSAVCTPTRYSILTGRYSWRSTLKSGVLNGESEALIDPERLTVASLLKSAGYHTAYIGKWHLGWNWSRDANGNIQYDKPVAKSANGNGFDYTFALPASLDMPPYVYVENGLTTAIPHDTTENKDYQGLWRKGITGPDFIHEQVLPEFISRSIKYIQKQAKSGQPFFLYLPLASPHTPILPTKEWQGKSGLNAYGDFVMMTDHYIGKLEAAIKEAGIEENTLIIFTSDNGCSPRAKFEELNAKGHNSSYIFRGAKADIFEGGHRIPLIVKWPATINAGSKNNQTTCLVDLMATCADIVNKPLPHNAGEDSYSMLSMFQNSGNNNYKRSTTIHHSINGSFAIRKGKWKLILCPGSGGWSAPVPAKAKTMNLPPFQLFDLEKDPGETKNLYEQHPDIVQALKTQISKEISEGRSTPGAKQQNDGPVFWDELSWMKKAAY